MLADYEGVLPGMTPVMHLKDDQRAWLADLKAKGYEVPPGHHGVFRPKPDFPGAAERGPTYAPARYKAEDSNAAFLTGEAIKYISVRGDEPWFVHLSYLAPHPPFVVPEPYHDLYHPDADAGAAARRQPRGRGGPAPLARPLPLRPARHRALGGARHRRQLEVQRGAAAARCAPPTTP